MRVIRPIYGVMIPRLSADVGTGRGALLDEHLYEDRTEAEERAKELTANARRYHKNVRAAYVKLYPLVPKYEKGAPPRKRSSRQRRY